MWQTQTASTVDWLGQGWTIKPYNAPTLTVEPPAQAGQADLVPSIGWEDFSDAAVMAQREHEPARAFREYLRSRR